jgi:hypothetical protein
MADQKGSPHIHVTSHNQSGGITAHTVNIGNQRLRLTDELGAELLRTLPKSKPIETHIVGEMGPGVGTQIEAFLRRNGYEVRSMSMTGMRVPAPRHKLDVQVMADKVVLEIAPDAVE